MHPKWVPQLADAAELMADRSGEDGTRPAGAGAERARPGPRARAGLRHIAIFGSATETFAQRNLNRSLDEQFAMFEPTVTRARAAGMDVRAYVSMCLGDPWEGEVPIDQVVERRQAALRPRRQPAVAGRHHRRRHGGPGRASCSTPSTRRGCRTTSLAVHFHDTYGQALANAYAAHQHGISTFDASAGGLGGCPYAESATGNLATEDLVWMLRGLGVETGVDLGTLVETSVWMAGVLGRPSPSRVVQALSGASQCSPCACTCTWGHPRAAPATCRTCSPATATCSSSRASTTSAREAATISRRPSTCSASAGPGQRPPRRASGTRLHKRRARAAGTRVVSHEILAGADQDAVRRALESFPEHEAHVVLTVRDLGRQIPAEWQERVKHRARRDFAAYLRHTRATTAAPTRSRRSGGCRTSRASSRPGHPGCTPPASTW